jgi:hypothetical protein
VAVEWIPIEEAGCREAEFVRCHEQSMLYHDPRWLGLAARLTNAETGYLSIVNAQGLIQALVPLSLKTGSGGCIANSSPYFGSHGGVLALSGSEFSAACKGLKRFFAERSVVAANIIEPLFPARGDAYSSHLPVAQVDRRQGHIVDMSVFPDEKAFLSALSGIARSNLQRKAWRSGIRVRRVDDPEAVAWLARQHGIEMGAKVGGKIKTAAFFSDIVERFQPGREWRVYLGEINGRTVAGLLVICWREYVEYLTPVFDSEFRDMQPSSAVLYAAMEECRAEGFRWWNFGGTWLSQDGVRRFKESWGATAREYRYYVLDFGGLAEMKRIPIPDLTREYEGFYVYPF